jgi:hypothetical protein
MTLASDIADPPLCPIRPIDLIPFLRPEVFWGTRYQATVR